MTIKTLDIVAAIRKAVAAAEEEGRKPHEVGGDMYSRELFVYAPRMSQKQAEEIGALAVIRVRLEQHYGKRVLTLDLGDCEYGEIREGAMMEAAESTLNAHGFAAGVMRQID